MVCSMGQKDSLLDSQKELNLKGFALSAANGGEQLKTVP
jgi:hypothetical protein